MSLTITFLLRVALVPYVRMSSINRQRISSIRVQRTTLVFVINTLVQIQSGVSFGKIVSRIRTNPVFFLASLLSLVIAVFVSAQLANMYASIAQTSMFAAVANTLPFTTKVLYNFPLLIGAGGFVIILALYVRQGSGGRRVAR